MAAISSLQLMTQCLSETQLREFWYRLSYVDYVILAVFLVTNTRSLGRSLLWEKTDPYYYKWFERPQLLDGKNNVAQKTTRNITQLLTEKSSDIAILWASQSGTAEGFARRLAKEFQQRLQLRPVVLDLDEFDYDTICELPEYKLVCLVVSTYGEGEPSDNGVAFLRWVQSTKFYLNSVNYTAFGLGNSNYRHYNKTVMDIDDALQERDANRFFSIGKGDEAKRSTEEDFAEWRDQLIANVVTRWDISEQSVEYQPTIHVQLAAQNSTKHESSSENDSEYRHGSGKSGASALVNGIVKLNRTLTKYEDVVKKSVHLEVDISENLQVKYKTGDHLVVWPTNPEAEVSRLLIALGLQHKKDLSIDISSIDEDSDLKLPSTTTIGDLFTRQLEICGPVSREAFLYLSQHTTAPAAKTFLQNLAMKKTAYASFIAQHHINLGRLLEYSRNIDQSTDWSTLPLSLVIEMLSPMSPRYYSICSSSMISPRSLGITVSVKPTPLSPNSHTAIPGLSSTYLSHCTPESAARSHIQCQVRSSTFKLPASANTPIIMVAAGTGIAPFRAFIQQRARLAATSKNTVGRMLLFFGCQNGDTDFLYKDELLALQQQTELQSRFEIVTAFSRPGDEKYGRYIQHQIAKQSAGLAELLLEQDAALYICGSVTMAKAVAEEIKAGLMRYKAEQCGGTGQVWDEEAFAKWRNERKRARRWCEDVWG